MSKPPARRERSPESDPPPPSSEPGRTRRSSRRMAATLSQPRASLHDLGCARIERALAQRVRYRYVKPTVLREGEAYLITSPCCSRNVDPDGGVINIALLSPLEGGGWLLCSHDHDTGQWLQHDEAPHMQPLLEEVCLDPDRVFWP